MAKLMVAPFMLSIFVIISIHGQDIAEKSLVKLLTYQHTSLIDVFVTFRQSGLVKKCMDERVQHFINSACGLIKSKPHIQSYTWYIQQPHFTALHWQITQFNILKNDIHCSLSKIIWKYSNKEYFMCGKYLPFTTISEGNVTIQQLFSPDTIHQSTFLLFFHVISVISEQFGITDTHLSNVHFDYGTGLVKILIYIVGTNAMHILRINLTTVNEMIKSALFIHDGPSTHLPILLYTSVNNINNRTIITSSFQAVISGVYTNHLQNPSRVSYISILQKERYGEQCESSPCWLAHYCVGSRNLRNTECSVKIGHGIQFLRIFHETCIMVNTFLYEGPDTYSNDVSHLCQYGGLWIYKSNSKTFDSAEMILQLCEHGQNISVQQMCFDKTIYTAIVVLQYPAISSTMTSFRFGGYSEYSNKILQLNRSSSYYFGQEKETEFSLFGPTAYVSDILITMKENLQTPKTFHVKLFHYFPGNVCSCHIILYYKDLKERLNEWCSEHGANHAVWKKVTSVAIAGKEQFADKTSGIVLNITLSCHKCVNHAGYIFLHVLYSMGTQTRFQNIKVKDYLFQADFSNPEIDNTNTMNLENIPNYIIFLRVISKEDYFLVFDTTWVNIKESSTNSIMTVTLLECIDGKERSTTIDLFASRIQPFFLRKPCIPACIIHIERRFQVPDKPWYEYGEIIIRPATFLQTNTKRKLFLLPRK